MSEFTGFPAETTRFLRDLAENNSKAWFDDHRIEYDNYWVAPAKAFVVAAGEALQELAPVEALPKVNGSIFRINRDVRFSPDKRPYKDHLDFWFWEGDRKSAVSGFYLRITGDGVGTGVGAHGFDKDRLAAFRAAVVDPGLQRVLRRAVDAVEGAGFEVKGARYKTLPRGFVADDQFVGRMLRHNALWIGADEAAPKIMNSRRFVGWALNRWAKMEPLHRWLVDSLE